MGHLLILLFALHQILPAPGSRFALQIEKTGLWKGRIHTFLFERYEGALSYDAENPERSQVTIRIDPASATLTDEWVNATDRKKVLAYAMKEMTGNGKYSELVFTSQQIRRTGDNQFDVQGSLTVAGIAKPVTVKVAVKPDLSIEGQAQLKLTDYNIKPPSAALGMIGTKDEMTVLFVVKTEK